MSEKIQMHATTATLKKQRMVVECLTDEEQLIAARTSYAYWAMEQLCSDTTSSTSIRMAMREARRHYVGANGDFDRALERFKRSLQWRKERRVDLLRFCFWTSHNDTDLGVYAGAEPNGCTTNASMLLQSTTVELSEEDAKVCSQYEKLIERDLQIQPMAVRGHDRETATRQIKSPTSLELQGRKRQRGLFLGQSACGRKSNRKHGAFQSGRGRKAHQILSLPLTARPIHHPLNLFKIP